MSQASEEYALALFDSLKSNDEKVKTLSFLKAVSSSLKEIPAFYEGLRSQSLTSDDIRSIFKNLTEKVG